MVPRITTLALLLTLAFTAFACSRTPPVFVPDSVETRSYAININTASVEELQRIPHIGEKIAEKIIAYRQMNGPFRRIEHLMLISGISDTRFRKIRHFLKVE